MLEHVSMGRRTFCATALGGIVLGLAGCSQTTAQGSAGSSAAATDAAKVRIGTMATEDFLPGWVAERDGLFSKHNVGATITTFQSAQELTAALTAGEIDLAMTDPQVSASLSAGGTPVSLLWIALGATPEQGRFGIMVGPDSSITSLDGLRGAQIGVGSNTVPEYVMDKLLEQAGIHDGDFTKEEIKKIPVRYEMMTSGKVAAAALPGSLLALGETQGCRTIADDTSHENLSQSVIIAPTSFMDSEKGEGIIEATQAAWNEAAKNINDKPDSFRDLLVEKAGLAKDLASSYPVSEYPTNAQPTSDMIQPQLDWMAEKGYLKSPLTFDETTGTFASAS